MKIASRDTITRVSIGIQARSTSERFPNKIMADICGKPMLQWVVESAQESARYVSKPNMSRGIDVAVGLLIPTGDPVRSSFYRSVQIIEGPEHDVLSRYKQCLDFFESDYIVRITGDCPMLPGHVITKCINVATMNGCDYVSNVDERLRLSFDGMDCEVISRRLMNYLHENAKTAFDREHVTTHVRSDELPKHFSTAHIIGYHDLSGLKLSVDTEEDLERVRFHKRRVLDAIKRAEEISGERAIYRF